MPLSIYPAELYLNYIYPDSVISYNSTRNINKLTLNQLETGKIYIFGAQKFPLLKDLKIDLFWSAEALRYMEPDAALNYLGIVNDISKYIFLEQHLMDKDEAANLINKEGGLSRLMTLEEHKKVLSNYNLIDIKNNLLPLKRHDYTFKYGKYPFSFWNHK